MRRIVLLGVLAMLAGCSWFRDPPLIPAGATVVTTGQGTDVISICDRGNLVYRSPSNPQLFVLKDGCNPDLGARGGPSPLAVAAMTPRTPSESPPPFTLPQPFLVQLVRDPHAPPESPPQASQLPAEPRVIVIPPPACPTCPTLPEWPPGWVPPGWTPPPAVPQSQSAPAPRAPARKAVNQLDPNTASSEDLEVLPGVTAKMAQQIVRGRPYRALQDLVTKKALTEAQLTALQSYLAIR